MYIDVEEYTPSHYICRPSDNIQRFAKAATLPNSFSSTAWQKK